MKQRVILSLASLLLCGSMTPPRGQAQMRGDFSLSCSNIAVDPKTAVMTANCKRADGSIHSAASIGLNNYVTNRNGNLGYVGDSGNFSSSCSNISVNAHTAVLSANCKKADGSIDSGASLNLNEEITNNNGNLAYVGAAGTPPPGPPVPGPPKPPPGTQTVSIPESDGSISGAGPDGPDFMPFQVRGEVAYFRSGTDIHITAVHIFGWATSDGNQNCGHLLINAKHLSINGTDYSGNLAFEATIQPQGWLKSAWVATFLGPSFPTFHTGGTVTITADAAFDGGKCILMPLSGGSISSSITL